MKKFKRIAFGLFWLVVGMWLMFRGMAQANIIIGALVWVFGVFIGVTSGMNKIFPNLK